MRRLLFWALALVLLLTGCGKADAPPQEPSGPMWQKLSFSEEVNLQYATQFTIEKNTDGYRKITIADDVYLLVPENAPVPGDLPQEVIPLRQPLKGIYLVSTSAMDFFRELEGMDAIAFSGTQAEGWYLPEAAERLENGSIRYAGKYSAPDYESLLSGGCDLAVENTMIYHTPEVKEKLESLGIPVLVERSSYESDPLGRMEWIKLYGTLLGKEAEAEEAYDRRIRQLETILDGETTGKTAAFFYINSIGTATVRKSGDYVPKMLEMAGGKYIFDHLGDDSALSTMTMDLESFYAGAKDADILIYNSTIGGELETLDQLLEKSPLLADFKAVKAGQVWCTEKSMFQESMCLGDMILDFHRIFTEEEPEEALTYLHRLR